MKPPSLPPRARPAMRRTSWRMAASWLMASRDSRSWIHSAGMYSQRAPGSIGYGSCMLERFDDLLERSLVREGDLDPGVSDPRARSGNSLDRLARPLGQNGVHAARLSGLRSGTGPARGTFGRPDRDPLANDLARKRAAVVVTRDGQHRASVPLAEKAALEESENVLRQLEQADPIRHGGLRAPDPLRDIA